MSFGTFENVVETEWLVHNGPDRKMRLIRDVVYLHPNGTEWRAPADWVVDGASIPSFLWPITGSPFIGDYRRASVVHDYFCDTEERTWQDTHRAFYFACRAGGVGWLKAQIMFAAVWGRGPRWRDPKAKTAKTFTADRSVDIITAAFELAQVSGSTQVQKGRSARVKGRPHLSDHAWAIIEQKLSDKEFSPETIESMVEDEIKAVTISA